MMLQWCRRNILILLHKCNSALLRLLIHKIQRSLGLIVLEDAGHSCTTRRQPLPFLHITGEPPQICRYMATASPSASSSLRQDQAAPDFLDTVLTPGSSLHPTFLLILNGAFALLLCVFLGLLALTRGNIHIFALICIEGCLWASVKW